jgi:hypothetical protein
MNIWKAADWSVVIFGMLALIMGFIGVFSPATQFSMMGWQLSLETRASNDHTPAVMAITSTAAVNMGILYIVGTCMRWESFPVWTIFARALMGTSLAILVALGRAPADAFVGAAIWEATGAIITTVAIWWDNRKIVKRS